MESGPDCPTGQPNKVPGGPRGDHPIHEMPEACGGSVKATGVTLPDVSGVEGRQRAMSSHEANLAAGTAVECGAINVQRLMTVRPITI